MCPTAHDRPQPPPARAGVAVTDGLKESLMIAGLIAGGFVAGVAVTAFIAGAGHDLELGRWQQEARDCYAREKATPPRCCTCPVVG